MRTLVKFSMIVAIFLEVLAISPNYGPICTSYECQQQAKAILSKVNYTVSPCEDFYDFACGTSVSELYHQRDKIDQQLQKSFSENINEGDMKPLKLLKQFYQACLNSQNSFEDQILEDIKKLNWPAKQLPKDDNFSWEDLMDVYGTLGLFDITLDIRNISHLKLIVLPNVHALLNISEKFDNLTDLAISLGAEKKEVVTELKKVVEFENELLNISTFDGQQTEMEIQELQQTFPFVNWMKILNIWLKGYEKVDKNYRLQVLGPNTFRKINDLLSHTSDNVIANFIVAKFILYLEKDNEISFPNSTQHAYFLPIQHDVDPTNTEAVCLMRTRTLLHAATSIFYVRNFLNEEAVEGVQYILNAIISQIQKSFTESSWMDEATKMEAIDKLTKMKILLGYVKEMRDDEYVDEYFKSINFDPNDSFFDMFIKATNFIHFWNIHKVFHPSSEFKWDIIGDLTVVNAVNSVVFNTVFIFPSIIFNLTYSARRPDSMNFGGIGSIIAHEIFHGFDSVGSNYDAYGSLRNWWSKEALKTFQDKTRCIEDQYGSYTEPVTGLKVDGTRTLPDNIADNEGFVAAYRAYQNFKQYDQILPDLYLTQNQLFWVSAAHFFCSAQDPESIMIQLADAHAPGRFRVNGAFGNSEEFLKDFGCDEGTKMNRMNKCRIW